MERRLLVLSPRLNKETRLTIEREHEISELCEEWGLREPVTKAEKRRRSRHYKLIATLMHHAAHPLKMYRICKQWDGNPAPGSFQLMAMRANSRFCVINRQPFYEPISSYDRVLMGLLCNARLLQGHAPPTSVFFFAVGYEMFRSSFDAPLGRLPLPQRGDAPAGGHSVRVYGYESGGDSLAFQNSWGRGWGNRGCGVMSREYYQRYVSDVWAYWSARHGPTRYNYDRLMSGLDAKHLANSWMLENPRRRWKFFFNGLGHQGVRYQTLSLEHGCPVDLLEIRTGFGLRVAWAHLFFLRERGSLTCQMKEFYVWPSYRRQHYGSYLERMATHVARVSGADRIQVLFHAMDAQPSVRRAGRLSAESRGYRWKWRDQSFPNIVAIGEKPL
jgi:hypothetical protein